MNKTTRELAVDEAEGTMMTATQEQTTDLGWHISDTWITAKVKSILMYASNVNGLDISVFTKNGVVALSGKVTNNVEHALAVELAKNVRGVSHVDAKELCHIHK